MVVKKNGIVLTKSTSAEFKKKASSPDPIIAEKRDKFIKSIKVLRMRLKLLNQENLLELL